MKKSIFLFFAAILCAMSVNAKTIYLNTGGSGLWNQGGATFGVYAWKDGGQSTTTMMTLVPNEADIFQAEIVDEATKCIFLRMNNSNSFDWSKEWNRKGDLTIPTGTNCCTVSGWGGNTENVSWSIYTPPVTHTFAKNSTLYVDFRAITDKKKANYPKAGSVGIDYSANAGGTVIPVTFTADVKWAEGAEFIKTEKGGWASIPFKAPEAGQNCAQVAADGKSYTWTTFSEPSVTLSLDKTEADAGTEVTVTLTATADNVAGEVTYAFQYSTDNATWNNITATDNTATQTFAAETRYYKVTMTNGGTTKEATAKFSAIKFHVIGSWDSWTTHNEVVEGSKTITLEANKTYDYKITNGTWDLSWGNDGTMERDNCTNWSFESDNNAKIKTDEAGDYVFNVSRNAEGKVKVSVTYPELSAPIPTFDYYIAGNMNGWDKAHVDYGMTDENADGIYEKEITLAAGQDHQFKVTNGKWSSEDGGFDCATVEGAYEEVDSRDGNVLVKLDAETTFTVIFDKNAEKISFEGLTINTTSLTYNVEVPAGTEKCFIRGAFDGWNEFHEMELKEGETNIFTITIVGAKETDEYKYACQASWDYKELDKDGNEVANRTWTANDVVEKWGKPVVYTYYLMGVGGDWTTGIEMEVNTGAENEVMLTCQPVNGEVKIKRLGDDESEYWYGGKSLKEEPGNLGTNTEAATDGDGNIALEEGIYNFSFNTADGKLWIATATNCYIRDVTEGKYGTICLPKAATNCNGATFFEVAGKEGDKVFFDEVTTLEAGVPYVFLAESNKIVLSQTGESADEAGKSNSLQGTFDKIDPAENNILKGNYMVVNNVIKKCGANCGLEANRAYFIAGELETLGTPSALVPGRRRVAIGQAPQVATGVDQVQGDNVPTKMIINGQLFILRGEKMYDAQGKLVK